MPTLWTKEDTRFLRANARSMHPREIAEALSYYRTTIYRQARRLKIQLPPLRKSLQPHETQLIIDTYGHVPAWELAEYLEMSLSSLHQAAVRLGVARKLCPRGKPLDAYVRERHAEGWSDRETAAGWTELHPGCHPMERHTVGVVRQRLGLPENTLSQHRRQRVAARTRAQCEAAGVANLAALRAKVFAERAEKAGWPRGLRPRAVQMLNALWDIGPMTRHELAAAIGMPWKGSRKSLVSNDPEGTYLARLMAMGLVITFGRVAKGRGKGKSVQVYSLPLWIERGPVQVQASNERNAHGQAS